MTIEKMFKGVLPIAVLVLGGFLLGGTTTQRVRAPQIIEVRMVDFAFEPADVRVAPGDRIRFIQAAAVNPHNVEFRDGPPGAEWGATGVPVATADVTVGGDEAAPRMGPLMMGLGVTYEVVIGEGFAPGTYEIVCTPHETQGMKGTLTVGGGGR